MNNILKLIVKKHNFLSDEDITYTYELTMLQPIVFNDTLDESMDTATVDAISSEKLSDVILPMSIASLYKGSERRNYCLDSISVEEQYGFSLGKMMYKYKLQLIEPTQILKNIYMPNITITNKISKNSSEYYNKKYFLEPGEPVKYSVPSSDLSKTLYYEVRRLLMIARNSVQYNCLVDIERKTTAFLLKQKCPEYTFTQMTLFDCLMELGKQDSFTGYPRLKYDNWELTYDIITSAEEAQPSDVKQIDKFLSSGNSKQLSDYSTSLTTYANSVVTNSVTQYPYNFINKDMNVTGDKLYKCSTFKDDDVRMSGVSLADIAGSSLGWLSNKFIVKAESAKECVIKLPSKIYDVNKIYMSFLGSYAVDTPPYVEFVERSTASEGQNRWCIDYDEWILLPSIPITAPSSKDNINNKVIYGLRGMYRETTAYFKRGDFYIYNIAALATVAGNEVIATPFMVTSYLQSDGQYTAPACQATFYGFSVFYVPMPGEFLQLTKRPSTINKIPAQSLNSQNSNYIDAKYLEGNMSAILKQRQGTGTFAITLKLPVNEVNSIVSSDVVSYNGELYKVTFCSDTINNTYVAKVLVLSKSFNKRNMRLAQDTAKRIYNIDTSGGFQTRKRACTFCVNISTHNSLKKLPNLSSAWLLTLACSFTYYNEVAVLRGFAFPGTTSTQYNGFNGRLTAGFVRSNNVFTVLSPTTYCIGLSTIVELDFTSNVSFGSSAILSPISSDILKGFALASQIPMIVGKRDVIFTDTYGESAFIEPYFTNYIRAAESLKPSADEITDYMLTDSININQFNKNKKESLNNKYEWTVGDRVFNKVEAAKLFYGFSSDSISLCVDKDALEKLSFSVQLDMVPTGGIFIKNEITSENGFCNFNDCQKIGAQSPSYMTYQIMYCSILVTEEMKYTTDITSAGGTLTVLGGGGPGKKAYDIMAKISQPNAWNSGAEFDVPFAFKPINGEYKSVIFTRGEYILWGRNSETMEENEENWRVYLSATETSDMGSLNELLPEEVLT